MSKTNSLIFSFVAGAAVGILAATLISKEDREKIAVALKEKAQKIRETLAAELEDLNSKINSEKTT